MRRRTVLTAGLAATIACTPSYRSSSGKEVGEIYSVEPVYCATLWKTNSPEAYEQVIKANFRDAIQRDAVLRDAVSSGTVQIHTDGTIFYHMQLKRPLSQADLLKRLPAFDEQLCAPKS